MIRKSDIRNGVIIFIITFIIISLSILYFGFYDRRTMGYNEPLSWNEYLSHLPGLIIILLLSTAILVILIHHWEDQKQKEIESARKRIEDRKKNKKERKLKEITFPTRMIVCKLPHKKSN